MILDFISKIKTFMKDFRHFQKVKVHARRTPSTKNLQKQFSKKGKRKTNDLIDKKNQSMSDSLGVSDFSGSSYNGPGNVDREKTNSNMSQRNF